MKTLRDAHKELPARAYHLLMTIIEYDCGLPFSIDHEELLNTSLNILEKFDTEFFRYYPNLGQKTYNQLMIFFIKNGIVIKRKDFGWKNPAFNGHESPYFINLKKKKHENWEKVAGFRLQGKSYAEIGKIMGLSGNRIAQIAFVSVMHAKYRENPLSWSEEKIDALRTLLGDKRLKKYEGHFSNE